MTKIEPLPLKAGYQARTLVQLPGGTPYEVATTDLRKIKTDVAPEIMKQIIKGWPFETTVYRLIAASEPITEQEAIFGDEVYVNEVYRRDFMIGDLYLCREKTGDAAALVHDQIVNGLVTGDIELLTPQERMAIYGVSNTLN